MASLSLGSRCLGCLLGGAIGDALGAPVEFKSSAAIFKKYGSLGFGELGEAYGVQGAVTDDTQMTLFTAEGLIRAVYEGYLAPPPPSPNGGGSVSPPVMTSASYRLSKEAHKCLFQSYLRWLNTQGMGSNAPRYEEVKDLGWLVNIPELKHRRAPGNTCLASLVGGVPGWSSTNLNSSKGCGGVMRVAPAALIVCSAFPHLEVEEKAKMAFEIGCQAAAITHSHPSGWVSAGFFSALLVFLLTPTPLKTAVLSTLPLVEAAPNGRVGITETLTAVNTALKLSEEFLSAKGLTPPDAQALACRHVEAIGGGWTGEEAIGVAVYCALVARGDFETGVRYAVNHSGDSDSTGAIAGNILGAIAGVEGVPERWKAGVELRRVVEEVARDLLAVGDQERRAGWREKYPPLVK